MSLLNLARAASGSLHREIEETPLALAMAGGTVDRETYVALMRAMRQIHEAVEGELTDPPLNVLDGNRYRRAEVIDADLAALDPTADFPEAVGPQRTRRDI